MIRRLVRAPALHFLCLGACLLAARHGVEPSTAAPISDEELLYRAAIEAGVDRTDRAVRERLAKLGSFVGEDPADEAALEAEARRLGLERSDVVVRRHLAQMMHLAAGRLEAEDLPDDETLAARAGELALPARVRFTQVYVSRARHGDRTQDVARELLNELGRGPVAPDAAARRGDAFPIGAHVGPASDVEIDGRFGSGFAAALAAAPAGTWSGPLRSTYGLHLVWVEERLAPATPAFAAVRGRLVHRVLRERREARTRERLAALRAR